VGSNKSKRSRSSSGRGSSSGSFKPGDLFGGGGGGLVPVFAIVCGVLIGMGGAYVVKRVIFGGNKKRPDVAMIEEGDRVPGRSKLKREARIRPVETAEVNDPIQYVEQPPLMAEPTPPPAPIPTPEPRALPKSEPLPREPVARPRRTQVAAPSKAPIRVSPPPRPAPTLAMVEPTPPQPEPVEEPRQVAPRFLTLRNLTYSRPLFNRCPEDCLLLFRAADGGAIKAKLKKSSFTRVLSSQLAYADIDGYESVIDGERVIVVKSIRGMPVAPPPPPARPVAEKVAETPKVEKRKEKAATEPSNRKKPGSDDAGEDNASDSTSLRNRLENSSRSKKKEDVEEEQSDDGDEEEGSSFQNRLKRSLD
jgi:hypothetical protein